MSALERGAARKAHATHWYVRVYALMVFRRKLSASFAHGQWGNVCFARDVGDKRCFCALASPPSLTD